MYLRFVPRSHTRPEDMHAMSLLAEGFRRLRAAKVSNAGTGAPGVADSTPVTHASDPTDESDESKHGR